MEKSVINGQKPYRVFQGHVQETQWLTGDDKVLQRYTGDVYSCWQVIKCVQGLSIGADRRAEGMTGKDMGFS